jgi:hypothetical protein
MSENSKCLMSEKEIWDALNPLDVTRGGAFKILPHCHNIQKGDLFFQQQQDVGYPRNIFAVLRPSKETTDPIALVEMLYPLDISRGGEMKILSGNHVKILRDDLLIHQKGGYMEPIGLVAVLRLVQP